MSSSATGNLDGITPQLQDTTEVTNLVNDTAISDEPAAPVAQMTEHREHTPSTGTTTRPTDTERYTSSGRSCRPVLRLNFVETPTFETEDDSQSISPPPSRQSDPGSRLSPELGTDPPRASPVGTSQNPRAASEPMSVEQPRLSTEDITPAQEMDQASRAMPPPPLPQTQPERTTPGTITRRPRYNITYSIEKSPGQFRSWDHYGTFGRMSMAEFQREHKLNDIYAVQFIVKRRGMSWDDKIPKNDDVAFQDMKVRFLDLIADDLDGIGTDRDFVPYDIWIIPIRSTEIDESVVREQTLAL
ncbi:hypothetical protein IL306_000741 [Fusarium sp. DS 682]|nr:hypothetical protein IL306_000741 [Fusarium sp. DS 682]